MMQNGRRKNPKHGKIKKPKKPVYGSKLYPISSCGRNTCVEQKNGFWVVYEEDGDGEDRGPTMLGSSAQSRLRRSGADSGSAFRRRTQSIKNDFRYTQEA